ncbi:Hypothetical Protein SLY_1044 [Strawberry lethal yellows phytoplasma (CPA) str. NZSb11]|uniref:Uncharacterized protein n=1 Tax=Strawberry lethal yellows phytoplasma (CPA) str. NZSb11 TaxID=980422 RepID=R4RX71_PHYAS|nr:Hypothetical Protein SLY_0553 [Strawberry lethal yellows phytoplasma (CPA) str. NZSb11]AGL90956.1 Hypothetical Protein SLY_1044 [Strawberry lethal yellows phytoplasma (CPA) str. NZSb11]
MIKSTTTFLKRGYFTVHFFEQKYPCKITKHQKT